MKKRTVNEVKAVRLEEEMPGGPDPSELANAAISDAASDTPGDDGLLIQEELYEGLSSDRLPSDKTPDGARPEKP